MTDFTIDQTNWHLEVVWKPLCSGCLTCLHCVLRRQKKFLFLLKMNFSQIILSSVIFHFRFYWPITWFLLRFRDRWNPKALMAFAKTGFGWFAFIHALKLPHYMIGWRRRFSHFASFRCKQQVLPPKPDEIFSDEIFSVYLSGNSSQSNHNLILRCRLLKLW